jgi:3',5'-nucleoside bisphosphate phosphatase
LADLHLHSCLSPCGDLECSPRAIARHARERGLDMIALTDHNSALNTPSFRTCCLQEGVVPVFGIEATSTEEVHLLCLFETVEQALRLGEILYDALSDIPNNPDLFGDQVYVDAEEFILGEVEKHLTGAVHYSLEAIMEQTLDLGGLFIPAHIDRPVNSISSQLGFLPEAPYSAVEITRPDISLDTCNLPRIANSDAHFLADIGVRCTRYTARSLDFAGLRHALETHRAEPLFSR